MGYLLFIFLLSGTARAECDLWKLKILNMVTNEEKVYSFSSLNTENKLITPEMKDYSCNLRLKKNDSTSTSAMLTCDHIVNGKMASSFSSASTCNLATKGFGNMSILDAYAGKPKAYSFYFSGE